MMQSLPTLLAPRAPVPFLVCQQSLLNLRTLADAPAWLALRSKCGIRTVPTYRCLAVSRSCSPGPHSPLGDASPLRIPVREPQYDVIGMGQAMVDFSCTVHDATIDLLGVKKSERRIISVEERAQYIATLNEAPSQVSAGGSLANTLVALSRLGRAGHELYGLGGARVGLWSVCGADPQGVFHCAHLRAAGVDVLSTPEPDGNTGTVIVLTTPDANRTFLSYLGSPRRLEVTPQLATALRSTRALLVEGYMLEMPNAKHAIVEAISIARAHGAVVALTAGDAGLVARHRDVFWAVVGAGVDFLFSNRSEAAALLERECSAREAARELGPHCAMAVVTDGANGSCVSAMGRLQVVPPFWTSQPPVDTCGAGDAYAAGMLFGWLSGQGLASMGRTAARAASAVIGRQGAVMLPEQAAEVAAAVAPVGILEAAQKAGVALTGGHSG